MKSNIKFILMVASILGMNSAFAVKTQSEMVVSVVVLSSCHVVTTNNSKNKNLDMNVVSQCSHNNDSYITVQNIDEIKTNNEYVLSHKENVKIIKTKQNEEYHTQLQSKSAAQDSDKLLVTINY